MSTNGTNRPTKLHISTQAVTRLLKERDYYHKEVEGERATVARQRAALQEKISSGVTPDENEEYLIDQRVRPDHSSYLSRIHEISQGTDAQDYRSAPSRRRRPSSAPSAGRLRRRQALSRTR